MGSFQGSFDCRACTTGHAEFALEPAVLQELQRWSVDPKSAGSAHFACLAPAAMQSIKAVG